MGRTLRLNCTTCGSPHVFDEDELFSDPGVTEADYVADAGTEGEHRLRVRRPPRPGELPRIARFGPYRR